MSDVSLSEHMQSGGGGFAYVYHIAGMPWAATNSTSFKTFIDSGSADALTMRKNLFGSISNDSSFSAYDVQVVATLEHDQGSQQIKFDERKGIDVGGWGVKLTAGANGYSWDLDDNITHYSGLLGLDFQPNPSSSGVVTGVMSRDFQSSGSPTWLGDLYWFVDRDNGLKDLLDTQIGVDEIYLWVGSSCLAVTGASVSMTDDQNEYFVQCKQRQFRSPDELILNKAIGSEQMIQISNVPFGVSGYTANLWGVPFDIDAGTYIGPSVPSPILFRTGKVLTNPRETGREVFSIKHSGFTGQLDYKVSPDNAFRGHVSGYTFTRMETTTNTYYNDYNHMQQPHIWLWEWNHTTTTLKVAELWVNDMAELGHKRFETLDEVKKDCVDQIAAADNTNTFIYQASPAATTLDLDYYLSGGDLVWDKGSLTDEYFVFMFGPVGWVCGFGYFEDNDTIKVLSDQTVSNEAPFYSKPRAVFKPGLGAFIKPNPWTIETQYRNAGFSRAEYWLTLREQSDTQAGELKKVIDGPELSAVTFAKNKSDHAYYMQEDWQYAGNDGPGYVPKDDDNNRKVYFDAVGDAISIESGDKLTWGDPIGAAGYRVAGTVDTVSSNGLSFTVDGEDTDGSTLNDRINWFSMSMHWARGWSDNGFTIFGAPVNGLDRYEMKDNQSPQTDSPVNLLKQLLGDSTIDVGVPRRSRCTTVQDLHGITGEKTLIDWDALESLIEVSGMDGVSYGLDLNIDATTDREQEGTVDQRKGQKFSIKDAFINLCLTHGIRMVWEYNESQRSWWMTFKPFIGDSVASASNSGRILADKDIRPLAPTAVVGGDWIYSNLDIKIRNQSGGADTFTVDKAVGKNQHKSGAKTLSINDVLTIIPTGDSAAKDKITKRVSNYLEIYSKEHYVQKYQCTVKPLANLSVGSGVDYTSDTAVNRETGQRGVTNGYADLLGLNINLGSKMGVNVDLRTSVQDRLGIAPSMYVSTASRSGSVVSISGLATSTTNNDFADPGGGLTDLATFDCYYYNVSDGTVRSKNCTCGAYRIWIFERNNESLIYDKITTTNNTVWAGSISNINLGAGTADITLDDTTNFDTVNAANGDFVVIYADRDDANLQPCQLIYGWLGDSNGRVQDNTATDHAAISWI